MRLDHPLLAISLKIADDLWDHADQLAGDVGDILLRQLSVLAKARGTAKRRLELRRAELLAPPLHRRCLLTEACELLT